MRSAPRVDETKNKAQAGTWANTRHEKTMNIIPQSVPPIHKPRQRRYLGEVITAHVFLADRLGDHRKVDRLLRAKARRLRRQRRRGRV